MCAPTGVKAKGLTGKFAMAAPLGFFEGSGLGTGEGEAGAEEGEEVDETGKTTSDWAPGVGELTAAGEGGVSTGNEGQPRH